MATNGRGLQRVHRCRPGRRLTQTLSDRARAVAIAAERPEPPASPGLVKRLFEWLRDRVERLLGRFRPSKAAHHQDRSPGGDVEPAGAAAAERARRERDLAGKLITAARAAARKWGDIPLATDTVISVAESISARPKDVGGSAGGPRADQLGDGTLGRSLDRGCRIERPCLGEREAAADERHQQALREWKAQSWPRRRMTGKPKREHPDPPNRHEVAAARDQLAGVIRSAMLTEIEKVMPQPRPASPPAAGARTPPVAAAARRDQLPPPSRPHRSDGQVERPAEGQRQVPVRTPDTRPQPAPTASPPRPPAPRDRGH